MPSNGNKKADTLTDAISRITQEIRQYHPKTVLLFGSTASYLSGDHNDHFPNDIDIFLVGDNTPFSMMKTDYGFPVEFHRLKIFEMVNVAKTLRYDTKPIALTKLYTNVLARQHAINVIAAALLLGPSYNDFGIEQIDINGMSDKRDYSLHKVLVGNDWWQALTRYARDRRGPLKRFSDKMVDRFEFSL